MKKQLISSLKTRVSWLLGRCPELLMYGDQNCIHAVSARLPDELWDKLACRYTNKQIEDFIQEAINIYRSKQIIV